MDSVASGVNDMELRQLRFKSTLLLALAMGLPRPLALGQGAPPLESPFVRGDVNGDGELTLADAVILSKAVLSHSALPCADSGDFTDNGLVNLGDVGLLIESLVGGPSPAPPFPGVGGDPTEDALGCGETPRPAFEEDGAYTVSAVPVPEGLRLRFALENRMPAVGGRVVYSLPEGWSKEGRVVEVKPGLELATYLGEDSIVAAQIGEDRKLRIVWLVSVSLKGQPLAGGASRRLLDVILCPGPTPEGAHALVPVDPGELVSEGGLRRRAALTGATLQVRNRVEPCPAFSPGPDTVRHYTWATDTRARIGESVRVGIYGAASAEYSQRHVNLVWDPDALRAIGIDKTRPESTLQGSWTNYEGYDSYGESENRKIEGPFLTLLYCDPCNEPRQLAPRGRMSVNNYHVRAEPRRPFLSNQEYHDCDFIFQVLETAKPGRTLIEFFEDPTTLDGPDNFAYAFNPAGPGARISARPLLSAQIEILPRDDTRSFVRGDANFDSVVSLSDPIALFADLFFGSNMDLHCADAADANDDGAVDIADAVYVLSFLFLAGEAPPTPFPDPGVDPTGDLIGCGG